MLDIFSEVSAVQYAVLFCAGCLIGISKTGIPGVGTLPVVLLALAFAPRLSAGLQLKLLCIGDLIAVACYRHGMNFRLLKRLLPFAVCGLLLGSLILRGIPSDVLLLRVIGWIILILTLFNIVKNRFIDPGKVPDGFWFSAAFGGLAGITTQLANAAGPVMSLYLLSMRLSKEEFIRTSVWFFFCINWLKLPIFILEKRVTAKSAVLALPALPAIGIGAALGILFIRHVPQKVFNGIIQTLILLASLKLILS